MTERPTNKVDYISIGNHDKKNISCLSAQNDISPIPLQTDRQSKLKVSMDDDIHKQYSTKNHVSSNETSIKISTCITEGPTEKLFIFINYKQGQTM